MAFLHAANTSAVGILSHVKAALTFCDVIELARVTRLENQRLRLQAQVLRALIKVSVQETQIARTEAASAIVEARALRGLQSRREWTTRTCVHNGT